MGYRKLSLTLSYLNEAKERALKDYQCKRKLDILDGTERGTSLAGMPIGIG